MPLKLDGSSLFFDMQTNTFVYLTKVKLKMEVNNQDLLQDVFYRFNNLNMKLAK
jgi:hypothetical protein